MDSKKHDWREMFVFFLGILLVVSGVFFNEWVVAYLLTYDNELSSSGRVAIWIFDLIILVGGILIILKRKAIAERISFSKKNILLVVFIVILIFGALEISSRVLDWMSGGKFTVERTQGEISVIPFRVFGPIYYSEENGERVLKSSYGETYPYDKDSNTVRIVAFGGSTTWQAVDGIHYPLALEERLKQTYPNKRIEVINTAFTAYATPHSTIILNNDVLSWNPDIVILSHNINDLTAAYFPGFTPDYANKYSHDFYTKPARANISFIEKLYKWSTLYWILNQQFRAYSYRQALGEDFYRRESYGSEPPKEAQEVFERNLSTFVRTARSNGIRVILGTQPHETSFEYFDWHMRWKPYSDVITYPLHEEYVQHHARYNDIIKKVARMEGAYLVDNAANMSDIRKYFIDNVHNTKEGIELLAKNYYDTIVSVGLIK